MVGFVSSQCKSKNDASANLNMGTVNTCEVSAKWLFTIILQLVSVEDIIKY